MLKEFRYGLRQYSSIFLAVLWVFGISMQRSSLAQDLTVSVDRSKTVLPLPQIILKVTSGVEQRVPLVFKGMDANSSLIYRLYLDGFDLAAKFGSSRDFQREGQTYWAYFKLPKLQRAMNLSLVPYVRDIGGKWRVVGEVKLRAEI